MDAFPKVGPIVLRGLVVWGMAVMAIQEVNWMHRLWCDFGLRQSPFVVDGEFEGGGTADPPLRLREVPEFEAHDKV